MKIILTLFVFAVNTCVAQYQSVSRVVQFDSLVDIPGYGVAQHQPIASKKDSIPNTLFIAYQHANISNLTDVRFTQYLIDTTLIHCAIEVKGRAQKQALKDLFFSEVKNNYLITSYSFKTVGIGTKISGAKKCTVTLISGTSRRRARIVYTRIR